MQRVQMRLDLPEMKGSEPAQFGNQTVHDLVVGVLASSAQSPLCKTDKGSNNGRVLVFVAAIT